MLPADLVSDAVIVWSGWGLGSSPDTSVERVVSSFGDAVAIELIPQLRMLKTDFYSSDAAHRIRDAAEMTEVAASEFRSRHPEIREDAVQALAWVYSFDNR